MRHRPSSSARPPTTNHHRPVSTSQTPRVLFSHQNNLSSYSLFSEPDPLLPPILKFILFSRFVPPAAGLALSTMENKISDFLTEQLQEAPEQCQPFFLSFEDHWERKLWHQLTDTLIEFFRLPDSAPQRLALFKTFVLSFADRINQLKFVSLGLMASSRCAG